MLTLGVWETERGTSNGGTMALLNRLEDMATKFLGEHIAAHTDSKETFISMLEHSRCGI